MNHKEIHLDEINLWCVLKDILRNFWVVVVVALSAAMLLASYYKQGYTPNYTSTATFSISAKGSSSAYNSLNTTRDMATVFAEVFQSKILREKVEEAMGGEKFTGKIVTATIPETNLMTVSVVAPTSEQAFKVLNLVMENYSSISDYLFSNALLSVIKSPTVPVAPSNPLNTRQNRKVVMGLAAVAILGLIVALAVMRDTVQTVKAARRKLDARVLWTVHHEVKNKTIRSKFQRKNVAPLINGSMITNRFKEENNGLGTAVEYHMRKRDQKVLMVSSAGENEGKSTIATNLALSLAKQGKKVLLLDCDFRKPSLHKILEVRSDKEKTLVNYLSSADRDPSEYLIYLKKHKLTVGVNRGGQRQSYNMVNSEKLARLIETMRQEMDYIVLDTPPMLAAADAQILAKLAETAIMVVRMDYMKTIAINDCLDSVRQSLPDMIGVVLNNYHSSLFQ